MNMLFTLRFVEWQCGHHCQRPSDIEVSSPEQAVQIAWAISHAISQPGHARAVVMTADRAEPVYITDDHVSVGHSHTDKVRDHHQWEQRPVVIFGSESDINAIHADELKEAVETVFFADLVRFDPKVTLDSYEMATSTLTLDELEALAHPLEYYEERHVPFELPPVFREAAEVLAELRKEAADQAAYRAEIEAEGWTLVPVEGIKAVVEVREAADLIAAPAQEGGAA